MITQVIRSHIGLPTPHAAKGVCIVCGSALVLAIYRGHPDIRKIHCNDCGTEVTALMHNKKQPHKKK